MKAVDWYFPYFFNAAVFYPFLLSKKSHLGILTVKDDFFSLTSGTSG